MSGIMNGIDFPVRRIMDLFRAYDAFPNHLELVDLTLRHVVELEVAEFFRRTAYLGDDIFFLFSNNLYNGWWDALGRRELLHVQDLAVTTPVTGGKASQILVSWTARTGIVSSMTIDLTPQCEAETFAAFSRTHEHLGRVIEFARGSVVGEGHLRLTAFHSLFPAACSPSSALPAEGHDVFVLDIDNARPVHLAQFTAEHGNFESDGGWFETPEVALWAYVPNSEQERQRSAGAVGHDSHQRN